MGRRAPPLNGRGGSPPAARGGGEPGRVMGTIAQIGVGRRLAASVAVPDSAARSERSIAVIRLAVTVAVTGIYASSIGVQRSLGPSAVVVLSLALIYGAATLIAL